MVKAKEAKIWKFITPHVMSEEEEEGDSFIRHWPSWRSDTLNQFLEKLERRFKDKHPHSLAKPRTYGEPVQKKAPTGIPSWMVRPQQGDDGIESTPDEDELFSA